MQRFDEVNPAQYRLFNIHSLLAPAMPGTPGFLTPIQDFGRFRVLAAPGDSYFDLVDVGAAVKVDRSTFYDVNDRWMHSDWLANHQFLWLDLKGGAPPQLPQYPAPSPLPPAPAAGSPTGTIRNERQTGQIYQAELEVARSCFALFKMTWHPNWVIYVDGAPQKTAMLSPGFIGVPVRTGRHQILCRYEPGRWREYLAVAGFLLVGVIVGVEWHRTPAIPKEQPVPLPAPAPREADLRKKKREKVRKR